jgi:hypothetical protein
MGGGCKAALRHLLNHRQIIDIAFTHTVYEKQRLAKACVHVVCGN